MPLSGFVIQIYKQAEGFTDYDALFDAIWKANEPLTRKAMATVG